MSKIHEQFGLLTEQFATVQAEAVQLWEILKQLKSGKLKLKQLTIKGDGWEIAPNGTDLKDTSTSKPVERSSKKRPTKRSR